jgi:tetratricopeptide (TPR) repeat protein
MYQKRYDDALAGYHEARQIFEELDEPSSVATAWHQIGMVHREAGQFDEADAAYRKSLSIEVQQENRSGQALSLGELGNLYDDAGRLEEAVTFYRQAADIHVELQDDRYEGTDRNNIADTLMKLGRYDEARPEIRRAIVCDERFGHTAQPWTSWAILHNLETATGNPKAAAEARGKAIETYRAYRRQGGYSRSSVFELIQAVGQAIQQGEPALGEQVIAAWEEPNDPAWAKALARKLRDILGGDRRPNLVEDPDFDYAIVVELELLLEELGS